MMMEVIIKFGKLSLNCIYKIFKFLPQQNKITFISRQHDFENIDFKLLRKEIEKKYPEVKCIVLTKMIHPGMLSKVKYGFHMFSQMYHLSTSKLIILDTYCILVSILKHKPELKIIQMWHALGALKQFGYSILDKEEGASRPVAELMEMHKNYTYVCASSRRCVPFFAEAFHVSREKVKVLPLPSTDLLISESYLKEMAKRIYDSYPKLKNSKKKIVYAPTFRKNEDMTQITKNLVQSFDLENYDFIIKFHPLTKIEIFDDRVWELGEYETYEVMSIADYVITDYSAIVFSAALMKKPLFFFAYDLDEYMKKRSFYIDYIYEMPGIISIDPKVIAKAISQNQFDLEKEKKFREKYIADTKAGYIQDWMEFIEEIREK